MWNKRHNTKTVSKYTVSKRKRKQNVNVNLLQQLHGEKYTKQLVPGHPIGVTQTLHNISTHHMNSIKNAQLRLCIPNLTYSNITYDTPIKTRTTMI